MGRQREEKERMTMERVRYTLSTQIIEITMKDKRHHHLIAKDTHRKQLDFFYPSFGRYKIIPMTITEGR